MDEVTGSFISAADLLLKLPKNDSSFISSLSFKSKDETNMNRLVRLVSACESI